jgi:putative sigma-54 modulation protein
VRLQVKGKNVELSQALKDYAQKRVGKLEKHLNDSARVELELAAERNPSIEASQIAEGTIWTKGPVIRAKESSADMKASIDLLVDKLERQAQRLHDKRRKNHGRSHHNQPTELPAPLPVEEDTSPIVKTKQFEVKPMGAEEAVLQLELIGHDFFMFMNAETDTVNVVYRRRDGGYGLIEPQLA